MAKMKIHPQGEFDGGIGTDDDGLGYVVLRLPDNRCDDEVELVFNLATFVTFADWVAMIADELVGERKGIAPPK